MHNLTKIRLFRGLLKLSWLPSMLLVYPLALLRRKSAARHVFLFDRYSLGGAQRVHIDILNSIPDVPKLVLFTRKSPNDVMRAAFEAVPNTVCRDIHFWCDNLLFRLFAVHYWSIWLNRHAPLKILSSNSTFFYDLLPWLSKKHCRIELLHNFTYGKKGMEFFGLANHAFLDYRLVVDLYTAQNIREQYDVAGIDKSYAARIQVIEPGVVIPEHIPAKVLSPLKVLYAGRGGVQKRVWLIDRIAAHCYREGWPVEFHFAGEADGELSEYVKSRSVMHGQVRSAQQMQQIYAECHILLLTSAYEGFPMTIKEAMANGCVPLVTALPGNKTHLKHGQNALLIEAIEDEEGVVREGCENVGMLINNRELLKRLAEHCMVYSIEKFDLRLFKVSYRDLLSLS